MANPAPQPPVAVVSTPAPPLYAVRAGVLISSLAVHEHVLVPRALWPSEPCAEFGGLGWRARIVALPRPAAPGILLAFTHARTASGRMFADMRLDPVSAGLLPSS